MQSIQDGILVINAGSSSIKFACFSFSQRDPICRPVLRGVIGNIGGRTYCRVRDAQGNVLPEDEMDSLGTHAQAFEWLFPWLSAHITPLRIVAAGHRVVHGGDRFCDPAQLNEQRLAEIERLIPLAPLHQPHNVNGMRAVQALRPELPQFACFDTSFHRSQPGLARMYALPQRYRRGGIEAYGFHGLSYESIARVLPQHLGTLADGRIVVAHLGNGASLCAMHRRQSQACSMGFSTLDGIPMGTRCGSLDPGVLLHLMNEYGMDYQALTQILYQQSGLLGVSGISADMRELLATDSADAQCAIDLFVYRISRELGAMAAALEGIDALVFTGGIGENAASIRSRICARARWLGLHLAESRNTAQELCVSEADSPASIWVIPTDEESVIADHTRRLLCSE